jgi:hypothetical protein
LVGELVTPRGQSRGRKLPSGRRHRERRGRLRWECRSTMVLVQLGVSATDAVARMRAYAFAQQRSLSDVAHDVVSRRLHFTRDMM